MTQKEIAISCLEKLDIYKPYIRKFKSKAGIPCFFENYSGFYVDQEEELFNKIKEVEKEYSCLVYAITHEFLEFGECWSMLCVPNDVETADDVLQSYSNNNRYYAFAYVWNATAEHFSEFGDVVVHAAYGGLRRIG